MCPRYVAAGYGASEHEPAFWIGGARERGSPAPQPPDGQHVAFAPASRAMVDAFYAAALRAGGTDNGPPGLREHYHPNYYACFVIDRTANTSRPFATDPNSWSGRRAGGT